MKTITLLVDDNIDTIYVETLYKDGNDCLANESKHVLSEIKDEDEFDLTI